MNVTWIAAMILSTSLSQEPAPPSTGEEPPVACRLTSLELRQRKSAIQADLMPLVQQVRKTVGGFELLFPKDQETLRTVTTFVGLESECCPFLSFAIELPSGEETIRLRLSAGDSAQSVLDEMFEQLSGSEG